MVPDTFLPPGINEVILVAVASSAMTPFFVLYSPGEESAYQVTFSEVSLPRSFAIRRNCSNMALDTFGSAEAQREGFADVQRWES